MGTTFGSVFRELRRKSGISQRRLAELCGVDFSYVSKIENDRLPAPAADTVVRFAEHMGCPVDDLLAAAQKLPGNVGASVASNPAGVRFLREASELELTSDEWEAMRDSLQGLRDGRRNCRGKS